MRLATLALLALAPLARGAEAEGAAGAAAAAAAGGGGAMGGVPIRRVPSSGSSPGESGGGGGDGDGGERARSSQETKTHETALRSWWNATSVFSDLPLREYIADARALRRPFLLSPHPPSPFGDACLEHAPVQRSPSGAVRFSPNGLLRVTSCAPVDGQLWVFDPEARAMQLAHDTTMCLDAFVAQVSLGAYWCHGGPNQQFRPRRVDDGAAAATTGGGAIYCTPSGAYCVAARASDRTPVIRIEF